MLPPRVTATIPAIRERRYVRKEDGSTGSEPTAAAPEQNPVSRTPANATSRQRIYVGKPGAEAPAPVPPPPAAVTPAPAPMSVPVVVARPDPTTEDGFFPVSAYTRDEAARLGTPRGLIPFAELPALKPTLSEEEEIEALVEARTQGGLEPGPAHDPLLDEVIEGLRSRIDQLKAARRGAPSAPGDIASPPTHPTASLMRPIAPEERSGPSMLGALLILVVSGAAAFGGFHLRQQLDPPPAPAVATTPVRAESPAAAPAAPRQWEESILPRLDAILSAEQAASIEEMGRLLTQLQAERPGLPGMDVLGARQSLLARHFAETEVRLSRLLAETPERECTLRAEISYLRARNYAAQRKLLEARACLDEAIRNDPARAEFHYEQAEINRRMGRVGDAMLGFDRALTRAIAGRQPLRATIEFRRRLTLVECGREAEIGNEAYLAELSRPTPAGAWVLTAAAVALHRGDFTEGARWMQRARSVMRPTEYLLAIEDYFFRNHAGRPELKDCFPAPAERSAFLLRTMPFLADP